MRLFLSIFLLLGFASCQQSVPEMLCSQGWKLDGFDITTALEKELTGVKNKSIRESLRKSLEKSLPKSEVNWRFYPDQTCGLLVDGRYTAGRWAFSEKTGLLTMNSGDARDVYRVEVRDKDLILWQLGSKGNDTGQLAVTLQPNDEYQNGDIDLLAPARNTWRIKPARPEMFHPIKMRLSDQLTYMIDYFELVKKKEQKFFSITHLNAPFTFYNGGMGLLNFNELSPEWKGQYYSEGDALLAHVLLDGAFQSDIIFPHSEKSYSDAYAKFLKQVKVYVLAQEEPETLPVQ